MRLRLRFGFRGRYRRNGFGLTFFLRDLDELHFERSGFERGAVGILLLIRLDAVFGVRELRLVLERLGYGRRQVARGALPDAFVVLHVAYALRFVRVVRYEPGVRGMHDEYGYERVRVERLALLPMVPNGSDDQSGILLQFFEVDFHTGWVLRIIFQFLLRAFIAYLVFLRVLGDLGSVG